MMGNRYAQIWDDDKSTLLKAVFKESTLFNLLVIPSGRFLSPLIFFLISPQR